jgi:hypothetical protein
MAPPPIDCYLLPGVSLPRHQWASFFVVEHHVRRQTKASSSPMFA